MKKPSDPADSWASEREKIIGLGERSLRKTYFPELQQKLDELERFKALLDQSNDCIFLLRIPSFTLIDVNESACRQLGCSHKEFCALSFEQFVPPEAVARIRELALLGLSLGKEQDTITTELARCPGGKIPVEITIRLVTFNKELYGVAVARDITERLQAEKLLLENTLLRRDMELARQIQLSLLPTSPPELPDALLAGCCVPAAHVGGDYYDFYRREDGSLDLVIADVSGHSIGAALLMVEFRAVLRAQVHGFSATGKLLASLNDVLYDDLNQSGLFVTLFYLKYAPDTRTATYSNAGHTQPLLFRAGEESCLALDAEGMVLGIINPVKFEEKELRMQAGDVLLLHTDGITEAENDSGERFGSNRLCAVLRAVHDQDPQTIVAAVLRAVADFRGATPQQDDVAMIVLKVA